MAEEYVANEAQSVTVFINHPDLEGGGYALYGMAIIGMVLDDENNGLTIQWVPDENEQYYQVREYERGE